MDVKHFSSLFSSLGTQPDPEILFATREALVASELEKTQTQDEYSGDGEQNEEKNTKYSGIEKKDIKILTKKIDSWIQKTENSKTVQELIDGVFVLNKPTEIMEITPNSNKKRSRRRRRRRHLNYAGINDMMANNLPQIPKLPQMPKMKDIKSIHNVAVNALPKVDLPAMKSLPNPKFAKDMLTAEVIFPVIFVLFLVFVRLIYRFRGGSS